MAKSRTTTHINPVRRTPDPAVRIGRTWTHDGREYAIRRDTSAPCGMSVYTRIQATWRWELVVHVRPHDYIRPLMSAAIAHMTPLPRHVHGVSR